MSPPTVVAIMVLLLLTPSIRADYQLSKAFMNAAQCSAGSPVMGTTVNYLGCANFNGMYQKLMCTSTTAGSLSYYSDPSCTIAVVPAYPPSPLTFSGCTASSNVIQSCVSGSFSLPVGVSISSYTGPDSCPITANNVLSSVTTYGLSCITSGSGSQRYSCTNGAPGAMSYSTNDCSGTGSSSNIPAGCEKGSGNPRVWSCISDAPAPAPAPASTLNVVACLSTDCTGQCTSLSTLPTTGACTVTTNPLIWASATAALTANTYSVNFFTYEKACTGANCCSGGVKVTYPMTIGVAACRAVGSSGSSLYLAATPPANPSGAAAAATAALSVALAVVLAAAAAAW